MSEPLRLYGPVKSTSVEEDKNTPYGRTSITCELQDGHKIVIDVEHMGSPEKIGSNFAVINVHADDARYSVNRDSSHVQVNVYFPTE